MLLMKWVAAIVVVCLTPVSFGEIRVISPKNWNDGHIELKHNMALFGRPSYGGKHVLSH